GDSPGDSLRFRRHQAKLKQDARDGETDTRQHISEDDHRLSSPAVEEAAEKERAEEVAGGKRQYVPADRFRGDAIESGQHQRVGKEDGVVEKGLRGHEGKADQGTLTVIDEQGTDRVADGGEPARPQPCRRRIGKRETYP